MVIISFHKQFSSQCCKPIYLPYNINMGKIKWRLNANLLNQITATKMLRLFRVRAELGETVFCMHL